MIAPSKWVERFYKLAPDGGDVLDLACGSGRHGRLFLETNANVTFLDRNLENVRDLQSHTNAKLMEYDLEDGSPWPFSAADFDAIVVTNYLHRPLMSCLKESLRPGGILIYETFALGQEQFGRPSNPDFLLSPGELYETFVKDLNVIAFEQGVLNDEKVVQRICASKTTEFVSFN